MCLEPPRVTAVPLRVSEACSTEGAMRILLIATALLAAAPAHAGPVVLKLGTLAPQASAWHEILKEMGREWEEASAGTVKLKVYAGGTQGSEGDMIRKLGIGQLQA